MSERTRRGGEILGFTPHRDQIALGDLLDTNIETVAVSWPRRAGKSEGIWLWLLGLCDTEEFTNVFISAQTGAKARERLLTTARRLDRYYPEDAGGPKIRRGAVADIEFPNGSRIQAISPDPDNFRGDAIRVVWLDEAQAHDPLKSEDLRQAVPPVLDTVENGQVILSGTPGTMRAGWYWDALEGGRNGAQGIGLSEFALPEDADVHDEALWPSVHPGLKHGLTTLEKMRNRHAAATDLAWRMEYCGQWPVDTTTHALNVEHWKRDAAPMPDEARPERVGLAYDVAIDGSTAALLAAWRGEDGRPVVEVLAAEAGTQWLPRAVQTAQAKHRRYAVAYDNIGSNVDIATAVRQMRPAPRLQAFQTRDILAAAQRFSAEISGDGVVHFDQADLNAAVDNAGWRDVNRSGRAFTRRDRNGAPINALVAASLALWQYDQTRDGGAVLPI